MYNIDINTLQSSSIITKDNIKKNDLKRDIIYWVCDYKNIKFIKYIMTNKFVLKKNIYFLICIYNYYLLRNSVVI